MYTTPFTGLFQSHDNCWARGGHSGDNAPRQPLGPPQERARSVRTATRGRDHRFGTRHDGVEGGNEKGKRNLKGKKKYARQKQVGRERSLTWSPARVDRETAFDFDFFPFPAFPAPPAGCRAQRRLKFGTQRLMEREVSSFAFVFAQSTKFFLFSAANH